MYLTDKNLSNTFYSEPFLACNEMNIQSGLFLASEKALTIEEKKNSVTSGGKITLLPIILSFSTSSLKVKGSSTKCRNTWESFLR